MNNQEMEALANLVQERVNSLMCQALISQETAERREWWERLMWKLEAMKVEAKGNK